jgi:steroid delta-isomerase-like uncharacterized protein
MYGLVYLDPDSMPRKGIEMSTEKNKAVVRGYIEQVWNGRRTDLIEQYMSEDVVHHDAPGLDDRDSIKNFIAMTLDSVPDVRIGIEAEIAEGDLVVLRQSVSGTPKGEFMGVPASGKQFSVPAVFVFRVAGGKIAELWGMADGLGMMQQLGAIPTPEFG